LAAPQADSVARRDVDPLDLSVTAPAATVLHSGHAEVAYTR